MAFFCSSRLDAYFLTIIAGIDNTERVASDFSNDISPHNMSSNIHALVLLQFNTFLLAMLDNILYARAYTSEHQMELLDFVAAKFHEEGGVFRLLIVDSIMALYRVDYSGRGELAERQQSLAQMLSRLQKISEEYNIAVFITNQVGGLDATRK